MSSEIEQLLAYERVCRGRSPSGFFGDTWYFGVHEHGLRMFSYIQCVHPIQDYDTQCRNHHRSYCVCLFVLADWERGIDSHGRVYYIDHINRTTTWVRPRRSKQFTSTRPSPNQTSALTYYLGQNDILGKGQVGSVNFTPVPVSFFFFLPQSNC